MLEQRVLMAAVTSFTLIDADTNQPMAGYASLTNGATLDLSSLPTTRMNVRANADGTTRSVKFAYDANANYRVESAAPFAFASDPGGDYAPWTPSVGSHTIKATPYSQTGATGTAGPALTVSFNVITGDSTPTDPPPAGAVLSGMTLINAATNQSMGAFVNGAVVDLSTPDKKISVRADVVAGKAVGSVQWVLDGKVFRTENSQPFAVANDSGGKFLPWNIAPGSYTLTVIPFSGTGATGTRLPSVSTTFTVKGPTPPPPQGGGSAPTNFAAANPTSSTLDLSWSAPTENAGDVTAYRISYAPGEYLPGTAGQWQTIEVPANTTSLQLTNLLSFTLYSVKVAAVRADGVGAAASAIAWTAKPADMRRYLYLVNAPKNVTGFTNLKRHIEVFDIDNGHKWVKNIPLPSGIYNIRGVAASPSTGRLYISYFLTATNGYQPGGLLCLDLNTNALIWRRDYPASQVPSPDRFDITPDGKTIYMPVGEHGTDRFWAIIDAANGNVTGRVYHTTAPHNTIVSLDGKFAFLEGQEKGTQPADVYHTLGVVDTATNQVVRKVGPFKGAIRPFTINGSATLAFATMNDFIGFQIGSIETGKVLFTVPVPGVTQPAPNQGKVQNHGILLTPDEKEIWLVDTGKVGIHVYDVSGVKQGKAPTYVKFVAVRKPGKNLAGQTDSLASRDATGVPAWINRSHDGKFIYSENGEIIDAATKTVIGQLRGKETNSAGQLVDAPYSHSRFMIEVQTVGGKVTRATDQFGIGLVR
jgi:hypothetical protein